MQVVDETHLKFSAGCPESSTLRSTALTVKFSSFNVRKTNSGRRLKVHTNVNNKPQDESDSGK